MYMLFYSNTLFTVKRSRREKERVHFSTENTIKRAVSVKVVTSRKRRIIDNVKERYKCFVLTDIADYSMKCCMNSKSSLSQISSGSGLVLH